MKQTRIPFAGSYTSRDATNTTALLNNNTSKDQRFLDCQFDVEGNSLSGNKRVLVSPREAYVDSGIPASSGAGSAVHIWREVSTSTPIILSAFGNINSTLFRSITSLGAITGICYHMNESSVGGVATALFTSNGNRGYYYPDGGALTEITNANFPPKQGTPLIITGNFAVMDGKHFIMCTNGQIWESDFNSIANWSANAFIQCQEFPDNGVAVMRHKNYIVGFSTNSLEFFQNTGNASGSILSRIAGVSRKIGAINARGICEIDDKIAFIGNANGVVGIYLVNGFEVEKISTDVIDQWLSDGNWPDSVLSPLVSWSRPMLIIAGNNDQKVLAYDLVLKVWQPWGISTLHASDAAVTGSGSVVRGVYVTSASSSYFQNNRTMVSSAEIQTIPIDLGTNNRKVAHAIRVIGERHPGGGAVLLSWSDDDYQNFSSGQNINLDVAVPEFRGGGEFRKRAFKLSGFPITTDRMRFEAIELDYTAAKS